MNKETIKLFIHSYTFIVSILILLFYAVCFHNQIFFNGKNMEYVFYFLLALLPLVLAVFAILISFTDIDFLKFLKKEKTNSGKSIYDEIVYYFKLNTFWMIIALLYVSLILWCSLWDYMFLEILVFQYVTVFIVSYTIISFLQVVRFIFFFAKKKAEFVEN
jgi:hypothetical protein